MSVVDKLKRLHKQTLLKLKDIKRAVIADEAGVNNEEYLSRARTLDSYVNPNKDEEQVETLKEETKENVQQAAQPLKATKTSSSKKAKTFKM